MASNLLSCTLRASRNGFQGFIRPKGQAIRSMAGGPIKPSIKSGQETFQGANDMPVYIKGGVFDRVLYAVTMGLCVTSLSLIAYNITSMARKK